MRDYYTILGIDRSSTQAQIKKAYRFLASKLHPDKHFGDVFFSEKFIELKEAYDILSNEHTRSRYDRANNENNNDELRRLRQEYLQKLKILEEREGKLKRSHQNLQRKENDVSSRYRRLKTKQQEIERRELEIQIKEKRIRDAQNMRNAKQLEKERDERISNVLFQNKYIMVNEEFIKLNGQVIPLRRCTNVYLYKIKKSKTRIIGGLIVLSGLMFTIFIPPLFVLVFIGIYLIFYKDRFRLSVEVENQHLDLIETKRSLIVKNLHRKIYNLINPSSMESER